MECVQRCVIQLPLALFMALVCFGHLFAGDVSDQPKHLFVVIPSYNNCQLCEDNLESVFCQTYQNWTIYYVDDLSTDGTGGIVDRYVDKRGMREKCRIVHNTTRVGALENLYNAIHKADPHSIVINLDGDDKLADMDVFQTVVDAYADPNIWLTYGSYSDEPAGVRGVCELVPDEVLTHASIRSYRKWVTSHLRTFYAALFHKIEKEDLTFQGKFYDIAADVAIVLPMFEMASPNHIRYIDRILYFYNYANPISDSCRRSSQIATDGYIRTLPAYRPLARLFAA
jgi:glycosyltransferase involved in cell wall biosynthesis